MEGFFKSEGCVEKKRTNGEETVMGGPGREGLALLQGLLLCGTCGHALTVRYTGNGGIYPCYLCNRLRRDGLASKDCMSFRCDLLDGAIAAEVLKALRPAEIELALAALQELESRDRTISRQWQMRLERAEYEAALTNRLHYQGDPFPRLVACTMERRRHDPPTLLQALKKPAAAGGDRVRPLAQSVPDGDNADCLNQEGQVSAVGKPFTGSMIQWIRYRYQIPRATLVRREELTVQQVAERFRVSPNVVYYWVDRGVIQARRLNAGSPYWITLNETDEQKLQDWVRNSCRIRTTSSTRLEEGAL